MYFIGSFWFFGLTIVLTVGLSVAGLLLTRRFVDHKTLSVHHDVAGYLLSVVGTLYAVVLGFLVVDAMHNFQEARVNVEQEGNSLHNIFHLSEAWPTPACQKIQGLCVKYAQVMINEEWKTMQNGQPCENAHKTMVALWRACSQFQPKTPAEQCVQGTLLSQMNELTSARHSRLVSAAPTYDRLVWVVLFVGGIVTIAFTYLFGVAELRTQIIMTVMVAVVLSLNLGLVAMFDYPFSGDLTVSNQPFQLDLDVFQQELKM